VSAPSALQELVTPGFGPSAGSGWPDAVIVCGFDDAAHRGEGGIHVGMDGGGRSDDAKEQRKSEGASRFLYSVW
jgi:hypothetical protein